MASILIYSNNHKLIDRFSEALNSSHSIKKMGKISLNCSADLVIVDTQQVDEDEQLLNLFKEYPARILLTGSQWPEDKLIEAMLNAASGYFDEAETDIMLVKAVDNILQGDIWVQRHLVPKVIDILVKKNHPENFSQHNTTHSLEIMNTLSTREREVANMICAGDNNKLIARSLDISERTVKAHLTSTYKKLNVADRLHLALLMKELYNQQMPLNE